jgi:hypothetical protein
LDASSIIESTGWSQSEDIVIAIYYVGAAVVFAIALLPRMKE